MDNMTKELSQNLDNSIYSSNLKTEELLKKNQELKIQNNTLSEEISA